MVALIQVPFPSWITPFHTFHAKNGRNGTNGTQLPGLNSSVNPSGSIKKNEQSMYTHCPNHFWNWKSGASHVLVESYLSMSMCIYVCTYIYIYMCVCVIIYIHVCACVGLWTYFPLYLCFHSDWCAWKAGYTKNLPSTFTKLPWNREHIMKSCDNIWETIMTMWEIYWEHIGKYWKNMWKYMDTYLKIWRCPIVMGVPPNHHPVLDWDFPLQTPSILGYPVTTETHYHPLSSIINHY